MIVFFNLLIMLALGTWMYHRTRFDKKWYFFPALSLKIIAALLLGYLYKSHYEGGDTLYLFEDAKAFASLFDTGPLTFLKAFLYTGNEWSELYGINLIYQNEPRAIWFSKVIGPVVAVADSYAFTSIYLSMFSFWSITYLYNTISRYFQEIRRSVFVSLFLFPSFVFWTSGVMKETIAISFMCFILAFYIDWRFGFLRFWKLLFALLMLSWLIIVKYYISAVFITVLIMLFINSKLITRGTSIKVWKTTTFSSVAILFLLPILGSLFHGNLSPNNLFQALQSNHDFNLLRSSGSNHTSYDFTNWLTIPKVLWYGFLGPQPWEVSGILPILQTLENSFILILISYTLFRGKINGKLQPEWVFPALAFMFVSGLLLTIATPNFGTLVRYKVYYMPIVLIFLFWLSDIFRSPIKKEEIH